jgi:ketosteroid isomerase-like protein
VFVTDRGPIYGRQAIEKWYADVFKGWHSQKHVGQKDPNSVRFIGTTNNLASNGEWSETGQGQTGEPIQIEGFWSAIDVREGDAWKILTMAFNVTPAPAATAKTTDLNASID